MSKRQDDQSGGEDRPPTVSPQGDLTIFEVGDLHHHVCALLQAHPGQSVTLDLTQTFLVDGSGAQFLVAAQQSDRITIQNIPESIRTSLRQLGCQATDFTREP